MTRTLTALLIAAVSTVAIAQAPPTRGEDPRHGGENGPHEPDREGERRPAMNVKLADNFVVMGIAKASPSDIASGNSSAHDGRRARRRAGRVEVHISGEHARTGKALRLD